MRITGTTRLVGGVAAALLIAGSAGAWTGMGETSQLHVMAVARLAAERGTTATPATTDLLKNPGSFLTVRFARQPDGAGGEQERMSGPYEGRLIAVPANARAGDPAFASAPGEDEYVTADEEGVDEPQVREYGIAFAEGVNLGYTTLRRHDRPARHPVHRPDRDVPEFGSEDLHRDAVLRFGEASQPRLDGLDDAFRRAQLSFHRATLTPGVGREADGLRHERAPSRPLQPRRVRTRW